MEDGTYTFADEDSHTVSVSRVESSTADVRTGITDESLRRRNIAAHTHGERRGSLSEKSEPYLVSSGSREMPATGRSFFVGFAPPPSAEQDGKRSDLGTPRQHSDLELNVCQSLMNGLWLLLFGWWLAFLHVIAAVLLTVTFVGFPYSKVCLKMAYYVFWPFGSHLISHVHQREASNQSPTQAEKPIENEGGEESYEEETLLRNEDKREVVEAEADPWSISYVAYLVISGPLLFVPHLMVAAGAWMSVVFSNMCPLHHKIAVWMLTVPRSIIVKEGRSRDEGDDENVAYVPWAYTFSCWTKTVMNINIVIVNSSLLIYPVLALGYQNGYYYVDSISASAEDTAFILSCISLVPLSHFISSSVGVISSHAEEHYNSIFFGSVLTGIFGGSNNIMKTKT